MPFFSHHMGAGLVVEGGIFVGEEEGGGEVLGVSEVADLLTHASLLSSCRTCNQSPFTSRIAKDVPFFALPMTLYFNPGPSRRFTEDHTTFVIRRGGAGVTFGAGEGGGGEGFVGETVSDSGATFEGGFAGGSSFFGCGVVKGSEIVGFSADFVDEQPNKQTTTEVNNRIFRMEPLDKHCIEFLLLSVSS
jgi:hypothetical protein